MRFHVSLAESLRQLQKSDDDFAVLFEHGSMRGVIFAPDELDGQEPHLQDEIYLVVRGSGEFELEGQSSKCRGRGFPVCACRGGASLPELYCRPVIMGNIIWRRRRGERIIQRAFCFSEILFYLCVPKNKRQKLC